MHTICNTFKTLTVLPSPRFNWYTTVITTMARRPHILCTIWCRSLGALATAVRLYIASIHNQPMYPKMCSMDIFVNLQPVGWYLKGELFDPRFGELGGVGSRGLAHSIARLCVPISSPLTHMVYILPFLSYLAGSKSGSVRPLSGNEWMCQCVVWRTCTLTHFAMQFTVDLNWHWTSRVELGPVTNIRRRGWGQNYGYATVNSLCKRTQKYRPVSVSTKTDLIRLPHGLTTLAQPVPLNG